MGIARLALALLIGVYALPATCDEWPQAVTQNIFSPNGERFVRLVPASNPPDAAPAGTVRRAANARAQHYKLDPKSGSFMRVADFLLENPVFPGYATLTDDGHLVTFDQWFSIGFGAVITFYRPDGALLRSVDIKDLYSSDELLRMPRSTSSRWWRCQVHTTALRGYPTEISFYDVLGSGWNLDPVKATISRAPTRGQCDPHAQSLTFP